MKATSSVDPEAILKKLRKLESNRVCPNCGVEATIVGFGNVCVKFRTFVCDLCKTSHQAISHRVKSVTMSTWTHEEVCSLRDGGNSVALRTWLAKAPAIGQRYNGGARPKSGDKIEVYKKFILDCYDKRMFMGTIEEPLPNTADPPPSVVVQKVASVVKSAFVAKSNPEISLLDDFPLTVTSSAKKDDFGAFCSAPFDDDTFGAFTFVAPAASPAPAPASDDFEFDVFQSAPTPAPTTEFSSANFLAQVDPSASQKDPFISFNFGSTASAFPNTNSQTQKPISAAVLYPALASTTLPVTPFANFSQPFQQRDPFETPPVAAFPVIQTKRSEDCIRADAISSMGGMMGPSPGQGAVFGGMPRPTFVPFGAVPPRPPHMYMSMPGNAFSPTHPNVATAYGEPGWNAFGSVGPPSMSSQRPAW